MITADEYAGVCPRKPTPVPGIDETRRGKPRWDVDVPSRRWVRTGRWDTGFVDLHGCQGLLGRVEGPTSATVTRPGPIAQRGLP